MGSESEVDSKGAAVFLLLYNYLLAKPQWCAARRLTKAEAVATYQHVYDHMMTNFGTNHLVLGDIQKLVRGDVELGAPGLPDVLQPSIQYHIKRD